MGRMRSGQRELHFVLWYTSACCQVSQSLPFIRLRRLKAQRMRDDKVPDEKCCMQSIVYGLFQRNPFLECCQETNHINHCGFGLSGILARRSRSVAPHQALLMPYKWPEASYIANWIRSQRSWCEAGTNRTRKSPNNCNAAQKPKKPKTTWESPGPWKCGRGTDSTGYHDTKCNLLQIFKSL